MLERVRVLRIGPDRPRVHQAILGIARLRNLALTTHPTRGDL
ncbi:hypothetical protein ACIPY6_43375 [Streptomyces sp. NPDC090054]